MLAWRQMNNSRHAHLRADTLERYSFGHLTGLSLKRNEEHLLLCGDCRARLHEFEVMLTAIRTADQPPTQLPITFSGGTHALA